MENNHSHISDPLEASLQNDNRGAALLLLQHNNTLSDLSRIGLRVLCYKLPASLEMSLQHAIQMVTSK